MACQKDDLKFMVLEAVSNDFEEFETIVKDVQSWTSPNTEVPSEELIESAIMGAVADGDIEAHMLSAAPAELVPATVSPETVRSLWFYVTERGKERVRQAAS
jgi:hypothetical protein